MCKHAHIWVPVEDRRGHWDPWSWNSRWLLAVYCRCCELNSDPLEDQQALITTEPSLWPLNAFFNTWAGSSFFLCHRVPITKSTLSSTPFLFLLLDFCCFAYGFSPSYFQVRDTAIKFWKHWSNFWDIKSMCPVTCEGRNNLLTIYSLKYSFEVLAQLLYC